jgi:beta-glucanase (GH16 family)
MKWDPATGSWPAFWLLPAEDITGLGVSNNESGEIDIFEGQGATPHTYFGTIHDWKDYVDIANNENTNAYELASTVDVTQYHTYGILWVPGTITWYFDNELLFSAATYEIFDQEYFYPILSSQEGADWTYGDMTGVTASSIPLNVDWIHVWQK